MCSCAHQSGTWAALEWEERGAKWLSADSLAKETLQPTPPAAHQCPSRRRGCESGSWARVADQRNSVRAVCDATAHGECLCGLTTSDSEMSGERNPTESRETPPSRPQW